MKSDTARHRAEILERFATFRDPLDRLNWLVTEARRLAAEEPERLAPREGSIPIEGCTSKTWLSAQMEGGRCRFRTDSESQIIRGVAAILARWFDGATPSEILAADLAFFEEARILQNLSETRRSGIRALWEQMRAFAASSTTK